MKFNKGDLIAIKTLEDKRITAIIVAVFNSCQFLYCYVVDCGSYRLVYEKEVEFMITKDFKPDIQPDYDVFNLDTSFYEACLESFSIFPYGFDFDFDSEDE